MSARRARQRYRRRCFALESQRRAGQCDAAELFVGEFLQGTAVEQVRIVQHVVQRLHGCANHVVFLADPKHLGLGQGGCPRFDDFVRRRHVVRSRSHVLKALVFGQFGFADGLEQRLPMSLADADDGHVAIGGGVNVVRRHCHILMVIAGARRIAALKVVGAERRRERWKDGILHGHIHHRAFASAFAAQQGADNACIEMDAAKNVAKCRACFQRRFTIVARDGDGASHRLHGDVHGQIVAVRAGAPEAGASRVDQARVDRSQRGAADAVLVQRARAEVLQQHVCFGGQLAQQLPAAFGFQVQRYRFLVAVQHHERIAGKRSAAAPAHGFAARRLNFHHPGTGHG